MNKMIRSLKKKIKIIAPHNNQNNLQGSVEYEEIAELFAAIKPLSETKYANITTMNFGEVVTANYFIFQIRYDSRIKPRMHICYGERIFDIKRIINIAESNKYLRLIALEFTR